MARYAPDDHCGWALVPTGSTEPIPLNPWPLRLPAGLPRIRVHVLPRCRSVSGLRGREPRHRCSCRMRGEHASSQRELLIYIRYLLAVLATIYKDFVSFRLFQVSRDVSSLAAIL